MDLTARARKAAAPRVVCWFSAGAASAVATKLTLSSARNEEIVVARCATGAEHEDNDRFEKDCAKWFGVPVVTIKSDKYADVWDVWEKRKYIAGIAGAPCTVEMKVGPRLDFQRVDDIHVFGYTADASDARRAERLRETFFELTIETPLIDRGITKESCLGMISRAGIVPPLTYALGFPNANCIPCGKSTSPNYLALVRLHFPDKFERYAALCRELGTRPIRLNGVRIFPDEIPDDQPTTEAIVPSCDFLCAIAEQDL